MLYIAHKDSLLIAQFYNIQRYLQTYNLRCTFYIPHVIHNGALADLIGPPHRICSKQTDTAPCKEGLYYDVSRFMIQVQCTFLTTYLNHDSVFGVHHGPQTCQDNLGRSCFSNVSFGDFPRFSQSYLGVLGKAHAGYRRMCSWIHVQI